MQDKKIKLSPNSLAFIALTNEYCHALEEAADCDRDQFMAQMLKLLPRIYIAASDLERDVLNMKSCRRSKKRATTR